MPVIIVPTQLSGRRELLVTDLAVEVVVLHFVGLGLVLEEAVDCSAGQVTQGALVVALQVCDRVPSHGLRGLGLVVTLIAAQL